MATDRVTGGARQSPSQEEEGGLEGCYRGVRDDRGANLPLGVRPREGFSWEFFDSGSQLARRGFVSDGYVMA